MDRLSFYQRPRWSKRKLAFRDDQASVFGPAVGRQLFRARRWWSRSTPLIRLMSLSLWAICGSVAFAATFVVVLVVGIAM